MGSIPNLDFVRRGIGSLCSEYFAGQMINIKPRKGISYENEPTN